MKNAESVPYTKEDLPQVNPQLCEWLATINGKSSNNSIPQNPDLSTENTNFNRKAANQQIRNIFRGFRDWFTPQNEALSEWFENEEHAETGRDIMDMLAAIFSFFDKLPGGKADAFFFFRAYPRKC